MMRHGWNMMMGQGWLLCLLLAIIIGLVIYVILKQTSSGSHRRNQQELNNTTDKAMEILNQKLASGDISEDEYKRKKNLLLH